MKKSEITWPLPTLLLPLAAALALTACASNPPGTCTAFDLNTGEEFAVNGGDVISQDDCFATCRDASTIFDCEFTPSPSFSPALPVEPVI